MAAPTESDTPRLDVVFWFSDEDETYTIERTTGGGALPLLGDRVIDYDIGRNHPRSPYEYDVISRVWSTADRIEDGVVSIELRPIAFSRPSPKDLPLTSIEWTTGEENILKYVLGFMKDWTIRGAVNTLANEQLHNIPSWINLDPKTTKGIADKLRPYGLKITHPLDVEEYA